MEDIEIIEEINDGNLFLRKVSKDDVSFFYQSLKEEEMINYLSLGPLRSFDHSKRLVRNYLKSWDKYIQFNFVIELRDNFTIERIGSVSLWNVNWLHKRSGVGIWILPNYWGQGLGKRVIELIKKVAFYHLKLNRIEAQIAFENDKSIKMFKKVGFREEGLLKKYLNIEGKFHDAYMLGCFKN